MKIGILALQGAFIEHQTMLESLGIAPSLIRQKKDLLSESFDGLILPGGESTTMGKLLHDLDLFDDLVSLIKNGMPVFGTCAGMILLANKLHQDPVRHLGVMNVEVERNAYGRQLASFMSLETFGEDQAFPMVFIRAPYIRAHAGPIEVLSKVEGRIVAAREKNMLVTAFHPELTDDTRVHRYFLNMCKKSQHECP